MPEKGEVSYAGARQLPMLGVMLTFAGSEV